MGLPLLNEYLLSLIQIWYFISFCYRCKLSSLSWQRSKRKWFQNTDFLRTARVSSSSSSTLSSLKDKIRKSLISTPWLSRISFPRWVTNLCRAIFKRKLSSVNEHISSKLTNKRTSSIQGSVIKKSWNDLNFSVELLLFNCDKEKANTFHISSFHIVKVFSL